MAATDPPEEVPDRRVTGPAEPTFGTSPHESPGHAVAVDPGVDPADRTGILGGPGGAGTQRLGGATGGDRTGGAETAETGERTEVLPPNQVDDDRRDRSSGGEPPGGPTGLSKGSRRAAIRRTFAEFRDDNLGDWAASLTYYGILALFPAALAIISLVGLAGDSTTQTLIDNVEELAPGSVRETVITALEDLESQREGAGILFVVGLAVAMWSASRYVAGFMRASNAIYEVEEGRSFWKKGIVRFGVTFVVVILLVIASAAVVFTGPVAEQVGDMLGLGSAAVTAWSIAKWPLLMVVVALIFAILYWATPNVRPPRFRWLSPGAALAIGVWLAASAGFAVYVANFASYNETYGTFGGIIIFLVWLWISNLAILLGAELDAELARERSIQAGHPASEAPFLEPRDTRAMRSS